MDREKRKLTEAKFQSKNAVLGFVFGVSLNNWISIGIYLFRFGVCKYLAKKCSSTNRKYSKFVNNLL